MKARIRNSNVDVEIEGDDQADIMEQFQRDYPQHAQDTVIVEWEGES